jgi:hypothetical protein
MQGVDASATLCTLRWTVPCHHSTTSCAASGFRNSRGLLMHTWGAVPWPPLGALRRTARTEASRSSILGHSLAQSPRKMTRVREHTHEPVLCATPAGKGPRRVSIRGGVMTRGYYRNNSWPVKDVAGQHEEQDVTTCTEIGTMTWSQRMLGPNPIENQTSVSYYSMLTQVMKRQLESQHACRYKSKTHFRLLERSQDSLSDFSVIFIVQMAGNQTVSGRKPVRCW